jgi:hypothetical protein
LLTLICKLIPAISLVGFELKCSCFESCIGWAGFTAECITDGSCFGER